MKNRILQVLILCVSILLAGCPYFESYEDCTFPEQVKNFTSVNTVYDDYNAAAPYIQSQLMLLFSSNRGSNGQQFDLVRENVFIECERDNGHLTIDSRSNQDLDYTYLDSLFSRINTAGNELGPNSIIYYYYLDAEIFQNHVVYSSDTSGNLDLHLAWYTKEVDYYHDTISESYEHAVVRSLNTSANECYIGYYGANFINYSDWLNVPGNIQEVYFCSDRDGNYDIFQTNMPQGYDEIGLFTRDTIWPVTKTAIINSEADDTCPFISGNLLVFVSNRPGGYGGYDLYYCRRGNDAWSSPVNLGDRINTVYDEYRPIVLLVSGFTNEFLLFSSNRPGGNGGFDLYYTGIPDLSQWPED